MTKYKMAAICFLKKKLQKDLMFLKPRGFKTKKIMELFINNNILFSFANHFKSSSSTTSRESLTTFCVIIPSLVDSVGFSTYLGW